MLRNFGHRAPPRLYSASISKQAASMMVDLGSDAHLAVRVVIDELLHQPVIHCPSVYLNDPEIGSSAKALHTTALSGISAVENNHGNVL